MSPDCLEHVIDKSLFERFIDFLFQMSKIENVSLSGQQWPLGLAYNKYR